MLLRLILIATSLSVTPMLTTACDNDELLSSIELGDLGDLKDCLRDGADINEIDPEGYSPLYFAIDTLDPDVIRAVLKAGADTTYVEPELKMPMISFAASLGEPDVVEAIVDAGADVNAKDKYDGTAIEEAAFTGNREIVVLLAKHGAKTNYKLHVAAGLGEIKQVQKLLSKPTQDDQPLVNQPTKGWNRTPLHFAAAAGQIKSVEALLDGGADLNAKTVDGQTTLHMAANSGNVQLVELLLSKGADPSAKNKHGRKPGQFTNNRQIKALLRGQR